MSYMSASSFSSFATPLPSCDAWATIGIGTATNGVPFLIDNSGVQACSRLGVGRHGLTFSNPQRFGGGYYSLAITPEFINDSVYGAVEQQGTDFGIDALGTLVHGRSAGFSFVTMKYVGAKGWISSDFTKDSIRINIAAFSFSTDGRTGAASGGVTGGTYAYVPGASGYGVSGATYSSAIPSLYSKRTAVAYGTIVVPPNKGSGGQICAYVENEYNVKGVSAGGNSLFDVEFVQPLKNANYCVILQGEYESNAASVSPTANTQEFSILGVRAGTSNRFKTANGFRVESLRFNGTSWTPQSYFSDNALTERIHFMVFGGGTYGQP